MRDFDECRPYVMHLYSEHRRIHQMVNDVLSAISERSKTRLTEKLIALRDHLVHHFREEEEGGCIEEAVCRCPNLSAAATQLEREHTVLIAKLEQIIERTHGTVSTFDVIDDVRGRFAEFAHQLHTHDSAENWILQQAFGTGFYFEENDEYTV